jgi:uncharacterized protein
MHPVIEAKREALAALCRRYGVARLEVFGSAARGTDFDPAKSDADFLVTFDDAAPAADDLQRYLDFAEALEALFGRAVDLVERQAMEASRNYIRRRAILQEALPVYG